MNAQRTALGQSFLNLTIFTAANADSLGSTQQLSKSFTVLLFKIQWHMICFVVYMVALI